MTKDEAMRLALTALENAPIEYDFHGNPMDAEFGKQLNAAITALRQALEQPKREWVGLTDAERTEAANNAGFGHINIALEIEAKLKEKNRD